MPVQRHGNLESAAENQFGQNSFARVTVKNVLFFFL